MDNAKKPRLYELTGKKDIYFDASSVWLLMCVCVLLLACTPIKANMEHGEGTQGTAQSVQKLATAWTVRGSNSGSGEIFRTHPDGLWVPPSLLYVGTGPVYRG